MRQRLTTKFDRSQRALTFESIARPLPRLPPEWVGSSGHDKSEAEIDVAERAVDAFAATTDLPTM